MTLQEMFYHVDREDKKPGSLQQNINCNGINCTQCPLFHHNIVSYTEEDQRRGLSNCRIAYNELRRKHDRLGQNLDLI